MRAWTFNYEKKSPALIFSRQFKRTTHGNFSICSLKTNSFYHNLRLSFSFQSFENLLLTGTISGFWLDFINNYLLLPKLLNLEQEIGGILQETDLHKKFLRLLI